MLKIFRINIWLGICNNFQYFLKAIKPSPMETERGGIVQVAATICSLMVGQNIRAYAYITKALRYRSKGWIKKITGLIASNEIFLSNGKHSLYNAALIQRCQPIRNFQSSKHREASVP